MKLAVLAIALVVAACGSAAPASTVPSSGPSIPPSPTEPPSPSVAPGPTFTSDDDKIASIIKDGTAKTLDEIAKIGDAETTADFRDVFRGIREFATNEQTRISLYQASPCTRPAADLYTDGMGQLAQVAEDFLDWLAGGAVGEAPDAGAASKAGETIGAANAALQGSPC